MRREDAKAELIGSELWALETRLGEAKSELAQAEQALAALDAKRTADEGRHVTLSVARQEAQAEQASRQQQIFLGGQAIARLEQMLKNGSMDRSTRNAIVNGTPDVCIDVYDDYIDVTLL